MKNLMKIKIGLIMALSVGSLLYAADDVDSPSRNHDIEVEKIEVVSRLENRQMQKEEVRDERMENKAEDRRDAVREERREDRRDTRSHRRDDKRG